MSEVWLNKAKRRAGTVEADRAKHGRSCLDLFNAIRCHIERIDLGSRAFRFAEIDALCRQQTTGNGRLPVE